VLIWNSVKNNSSQIVLRGDLIRIVESQEQIASSQLVDTLEEQAQLEEMLEPSKPVYPAGTQKRHYLLSTPFRYPPLVHGSRFGSRFEPSLFYASKKISTAFAETAFYRFYFWLGMSQSPPSGKFVTEHTAFTASYYSTKGLKLQDLPFSEYERELTNPSHYKTTQELGGNMRENGIEVFEYVSARDLDKGLNVALFSQNVLTSKKPREQQQWLCETTAEKVSFSSKSEKIFSYPLASFLVNAKFPIPAV